MAAPERRHRHAGRCAAGSVVQGSIFADGDRPGASYLDFIEGQECADIGVIVSSGGSADGANLPTHIDTDALLLASSESHLPEGECVPGVDPEVAPPLLVPCVAWPQVWTADEARRAESEWMYELSPGHIEELEAATEHLVSSGRAVVEGNYVRLAEGVTAEDFPLPSLGVLLGRVQSDVVHGRGFALLRGLPVERWSRLTSVLTAYGIGLHWGSLRPQNKHAHLVGHVKDTGVDPLHKNPDTRIYLTRAAQPWHVDSVDLVGLMCLKPAKEGGMSSWASSIAAYNRMLSTHPHLAQLLCEPIWHLDRKGEVPEGKKPHFMIPIVNRQDDHLSVYLNDSYYQLAQRHADVPRMTEEQKEALQTFVDLVSSDELRYDYWLQPGDLQLLNNHSIVHTRTAFTDDEDPNEKRHLLRIWVSPPPPNARLLPEAYADQYGSVTPGNRGGIRVEGAKDCIPLEAE